MNVMERPAALLTPYKDYCQLWPIALSPGDYWGPAAQIRAFL